MSMEPLNRNEPVVRDVPSDEELPAEYSLAAWRSMATNLYQALGSPPLHYPPTKGRQIFTGELPVNRAFITAVNQAAMIALRRSRRLESGDEAGSASAVNAVDSSTRVNTTNQVNTTNNVNLIAVPDWMLSDLRNGGAVGSDLAEAVLREVSVSRPQGGKPRTQYVYELAASDTHDPVTRVRQGQRAGIPAERTVIDRLRTRAAELSRLEMDLAEIIRQRQAIEAQLASARAELAAVSRANAAVNRREAAPRSHPRTPPVGPPPDPTQAQDARQFMGFVRDLRSWAGLSYRAMESEARKRDVWLPRSSLADALCRDVLMPADMLNALTLVCGLGNVERSAWAEMHKKLDQRLPVGAENIGEVPTPAPVVEDVDGSAAGFSSASRSRPRKFKVKKAKSSS